MTAHHEAALARYRRESDVVCTHCHGTGRMAGQTVQARARKGGNASYMVSLRPGRMSMSERGRLGGRPRDLTLKDLRSPDYAWGAREPQEDGTREHVRSRSNPGSAGPIQNPQ